MFGLFGGSRFVIQTSGFNGQSTQTYVQGNDVVGPDGDGGLSLSELGAASPDTVVCFCTGTPIRTIHGEVSVEELKVGDQVMTLDHGLQTIRWISVSRIELTKENADLAPFVFAKVRWVGGFRDVTLLCLLHTGFWLVDHTARSLPVPRGLLSQRKIL